MEARFVDFPSGRIKIKHNNDNLSIFTKITIITTSEISTSYLDMFKSLNVFEIRAQNHTFSDFKQKCEFMEIGITPNASLLQDNIICKRNNGWYMIVRPELLGHMGIPAISKDKTVSITFFENFFKNFKIALQGSSSDYKLHEDGRSSENFEIEPHEIEISNKKINFKYSPSSLNQKEKILSNDSDTKAFLDWLSLITKFENFTPEVVDLFAEENKWVEDHKQWNIYTITTTNNIPLPMRQVERILNDLQRSYTFVALLNSTKKELRNEQEQLNVTDELLGQFQVVISPQNNSTSYYISLTPPYCPN